MDIAVQYSSTVEYTYTDSDSRFNPLGVTGYVTDMHRTPQQWPIRRGTIASQRSFKDKMVVKRSTLSLFHFLVSEKDLFAASSKEEQHPNKTMLSKACGILLLSLYVTGTSAQTTPAQLATHNQPSDCWTAVSGKVYDLTAFIGGNGHPNTQIEAACGVDGTFQVNCSVLH